MSYLDSLRIQYADWRATHPVKPSDMLIVDAYVAELEAKVAELREKLATDNRLFIAERKRVERAEWIVEQYEHFSFWHSYIPSAAELGERYDREHAGEDIKP